MRSKTPLAFMEQLVMVLVFALAATLCMQVFVLSDRMSRRSAAADRALLEAQNAAEALKCGEADYFSGMHALTGDGSIPADGGSTTVSAASAGEDDFLYCIYYDEDWQPTETEPDYRLTVSYTDSKLKYLWKAKVQVYTDDGDLLAELPVAGQRTGTGQNDTADGGLTGALPASAQSGAVETSAQQSGTGQNVSGEVSAHG